MNANLRESRVFPLLSTHLMIRIQYPECGVFHLVGQIGFNVSFLVHCVEIASVRTRQMMQIFDAQTRNSKWRV